MVKKCAMVAALMLVLVPASAGADWLFTPNIGMGFGGNANHNDQASWGASFGWMGEGIFDWEADLAYTPEFFEPGDGDVDLVDNSNVTSFMANVIIGAPVGGQTGLGLRPYFSAGAGVMQMNVQGSRDLFAINNSEFGINSGGSAMGFVSDHLGFRGDLRYYRQLSDPVLDNEFDIGLGDFDFWRGTVGVTFRW